MTAIDFTDKIKAAIERSGLTDRGFAAKVGYSPQYLCEIKSGAHPPSKEFVRTCCDVLGMSPAARKSWNIAGARAHGWEIKP